MSLAQIPGTISDELSRCEERSGPMDHGKNLSPIQKTDAALKGSVERALWKDDVLRAIESNAMDVHVRNSVVYLNGHIVNANSQRRIQNALRAIPGLAAIQNNLVQDDKLTTEVAGSLGELEHTYNCKFFSGASHGIISLNGTVRDEHVKSLAEKRVTSHPNVRGLINHVSVAGAESNSADPPFLQPAIGKTVYFLDGISGVVEQVIINPNNRRVIAMTVRAHFADQQQELKSFHNTELASPERVVVVPMDAVRYLTSSSGFLDIKSDESERYMAFYADRFSGPKNGWKAPYPYCSADVLFAVEKLEAEYQILEELPRAPFVVAWIEPPLSTELLANDSLGG